MSETPLTDALLLEINESRIYKENGPMADFARALERRLHELERAVDSIRIVARAGRKSAAYGNTGHNLIGDFDVILMHCEEWKSRITRAGG